MKIVGIAGGSGSGKTTLARLLAERLGRPRVVVISQDSYYIDQSDRFDGDGGSVNFDHPNAIDWELLAQHLALLKAGHSIAMPVYDFGSHKRKKETIQLWPAPIVLVDGILIFTSALVLPYYDLKIFIETSEATRFARRLRRDVVERGRTEAGVRAQFMNQVKPMHDQYVGPSKSHADIVISGEEPFSNVLDELCREYFD